MRASTCRSSPPSAIPREASDVPALPRPDLPPGPHHDLVEELHDLHHRAGWPSLRVLARQAGCSHTTVSAVFSSPRLPSWGTLELLVEAMDGDTGHFHDLWLAASTPENESFPAVLPIAGRRDELTAVRRHLETGTGLLLVTGEAGIGKTTLVASVTGTVDGAFIAAGSCLPLSSEVPLLPVADLMRAVHEHDGGQWLEETLMQCAPYVADSMSRLVPELAESEATAPEADGWARQRLFAAVETTLTGLTTERRLGLLVEDLHWADTTTLDLIEHLVTRGSEVPMVGTWRLDDRAIDRANVEWFNRVRRFSTTLALAPLSRDETREQLTLLNGRAPSAATLDAIHARTLGQPLFTDQLSAQADGDGGPLPPLLADLLDARLGELDGPSWFVARALGVADRPLTGVQLADVTGLPAADLAAGLRELGNRRLLNASSDRQVALRHPLLAEAIRRRLVLGEAEAEHAAVAAALASSTDAAPAEVARHWQAAGEREQELGWRVRAARAAHARFALRHEADQWARAIQLWPDGATEAGQPPIRLYDALAPVMDLLRGIDDGRAASLVADRALRLVPDLPPIEAAELLQGVGYFHTEQGRLEEGLTLLHRALDIYEAAPPAEAHVRALYALELALRGAGRVREAASAAARAVNVSGELEDPRLYRTMLIQEAWFEARLGDPDTAVARARQAAALEVAGLDPRGEVRLAAHHTDLLLDIAGDVEEVVAVGQRGLDAARDWELGTYALKLVRGYMSIALRRAGHVSRAAALIDPMTERGADDDPEILERERALLDMLRGRTGDARRIADAAQETTGRWLEDRIELAGPLVELAVWIGRPEAVGELVVPLVREAGRSEIAPDLAPLLVLAARAAADRGDSPVAVKELTELHASCAVDPFSARRVPADNRAWAATWAAEMSRLRDRQSVETWVAAAAEWDQLSRPHDAAYCRWRAAQVAIATGQATAATKLLRRAARDAREHVPLLDAIRSTTVPARAR